MENALRRNSGIDVLKTLCILFVVFLHTELLASVFGVNLESLCRFATPVFFVITGYYYSSTVKRGKAVSQIKKVLFLILVANAVFIALNAVYCVCSNESLTVWFASMFTKKKLFDFVFFNSSFVTGHFASFHLWYLYALLYVLIIANVLRKFGLFKVLYFLTPFLLIGGLLVECFSTQIFGVNFSNSQGYCYYRNFLTIGIPYFCIGSILNRYAPKICIKSIVLLLSFVFLQVISVLEMIIAKRISHSSSIDFFITTPLCAACVFLLFNNLFKNRGINKFCTALSDVGRNDVVWIYIYHLLIMVLVRDCLLKIGLSYANKALVTVLTVALSLAVAIVIDKTKGLIKSKRLKKTIVNQNDMCKYMKDCLVSPKTVMLVLPELHPVPNIKGGSVELLVTNMLMENEKYNELRFIVISIYDEDAIKFHFKNSKIYYYRDGWIVDDLVKGKKFIWSLYFLFQKIRNKLVRSWKKSPCFDRRLFQCLRVAKKEHAEILVFENFYYPGSYMPLIRYFDRENVYMHIHYHREEVLCDRKIVPNSISISEFVKKEWAKDKSISGKNEVLYNCINTEKYNIRISELEKIKRKNELGIVSDDKVVVFCGRFIPQKGIKELLDAFDILNGKSIKLILIGCYSYEKLNITPYSKDMAARAEKMSNVIYLGYVPNAKIQDYYSVSDIMVIPSIWQEGAGLVTIEGMAAGLPLIITDSGGMVEYVNDECAIKVPINDDLPRNLATQIERLSSDEDLRKEMGKAGKARAKRFNPKSFYDNYVRIVKGDK